MHNNKSLYHKEVSSVVDLSNPIHREKIGRDLINSKIIGEVSDWDFPSSNHQCKFNGVRLNNINFNSKDFRDCIFKNVIFNACIFREASIIGCTFIDCEFNGTTIDRYSIHDCIFVDVSFKKSTIKGSMIRYSRAQSCIFSQCLLDNKIFDECLLFDVKFISSIIDFRVLIDNFGLSCEVLPMELIRVDRSYQIGNEEMMAFDENSLIKLGENLSALESFRLQCYFSGDILFPGPAADNILSVTSWTASINTPSGFIRLIENLSEFVIHEFEQNRCYLYFLLRLHYVMFCIYENTGGAYPVVGQVAVGAHHRLGSIISKYELKLIHLTTLHENNLRFLTDGDADIPELQKELDILQSHVGSFEFSLGPKNSPVLLEILSNYTVILSIFLFTKLNFEITKLFDSEKGNNQALSNKNTLLSISTGEGKFSLTTSAIGDVMIKASIGLDSDFVNKIRKTLYKLLADNE